MSVVGWCFAVVFVLFIAFMVYKQNKRSGTPKAGGSGTYVPKEGDQNNNGDVAY